MAKEQKGQELKVGEKVRELREKRGLSLQEIADRITLEPATVKSAKLSTHEGEEFCAGQGFSKK